MNEMMIFSNPEFGNVRTVTIDGNPWFVGNDVAKALGYVKERNAIANHVDKEDALKCSLPSNSGVQETIVINESGLFSLILSSKLDSAKRFKHWVTAEVLPSIRKTGKYEVGQKQDSYQIADPIERAKRSSRWTICSKCGSRFDEYNCIGCEYECDSKKEYYVCPTYLSSIDANTYANRFGKTIFLTREEAEKKLEEMENGK